MKTLKILLCMFILISFSLAHSGRTDSSGGHYDKNTGSYHYHHGHPAHTICGINCPYKQTYKLKPLNTTTTSTSDTEDINFSFAFGIAIISLFLGFVAKFVIFLPLLIIDKLFDKNTYVNFVFDHSWISTLIISVPLFIMILFF